MKSPPILNQDNRDPEAQAAHARAAGEAIIRNHLDNHLAHNTGASSDYISWIATLHPENAQVEIDERFFVPGNPWWSIYEETVNLPFATAVAVPANESERAQPSNRTEVKHDNDDDEVKYVSSNTSHSSCDDSLTHEHPVLSGQQQQQHHQQRQREKLPHYCLRCNPVDMLQGLLIVLNTILITFILEVLALCFYTVAAFFYHIAQILGPSNVFTGCFYSFFMVLYFAFATADSAVLLSSVIFLETCNLLGWIMSCLFGGIWIANKRHQFVRRVCHRIRWAFRHPHLKPPRTFCKQGQVGNEMETQNDISDEYPHDHPAPVEQEQHKKFASVDVEALPEALPAHAKVDTEQKTVASPY